MMTTVEKICKTNKFDEIRAINSLKTCDKIMENN